MRIHSAPIHVILGRVHQSKKRLPNGTAPNPGVLLTIKALIMLAARDRLAKSTPKRGHSEEPLGEPHSLQVRKCTTSLRPSARELINVTTLITMKTPSLASRVGH